MAGLGFQFDISIGEDTLGPALERLIRAGGDLREPLEAALGVIATSTAERFDTETAPDGTPWTPSQRVLKYGGKTLTDSTNLRTSFSVQVGENLATFGTKTHYAPHLHFGAVSDRVSSKGKAFRIVLPARPILGITDPDRDAIAGVFEDYLEANA